MKAKSYQSKPQSPPKAGGGYGEAKGGSFKDRNLAAMTPDAAQNACMPTDAMPIRMHAQMAGDPSGGTNFFRSAAEKKVEAIYGKPAAKKTESASQRLARKVEEAGG